MTRMRTRIAPPFTKFYASYKRTLQYLLSMVSGGCENQMTRMKTVLASAVIAAGLGIVPVIAQHTGAGTGTLQHHGRGGMLAHMGAALNLTDSQKAAAKQIFADGRQQAQPVMDQMKQ